MNTKCTEVGLGIAKQLRIKAAAIEACDDPDEMQRMRMAGTPRYTPEECEHREWPHAERMRWDSGFECKTCGIWIDVNNEKWYFTNKYGYRQDRERPGINM